MWNISDVTWPPPAATRFVVWPCGLCSREEFIISAVLLDDHLIEWIFYSESWHTTQEEGVFFDFFVFLCDNFYGDDDDEDLEASIKPVDNGCGKL